MKCSVVDCGSDAKTKGLCIKHYTRLIRHGDVNVKLVDRGGARAYIMSAAEHKGDECLFWPYTKTKGYGWVKWHGKGSYAHRVICELAHGGPGMANVVRHSCGNGHLACVNPNHLKWGTYQENSDDTLKHGTRARGERQGTSKISNDEARHILSMKGKRKAASLAKEYGLSEGSIARIWSGKRWAWIHPST